MKEKKESREKSKKQERKDGNKLILVAVKAKDTGINKAKDEKDLEGKVIKSDRGSREKRNFNEYAQKIFDRQLQMLDYSGLFSYMDAQKAVKPQESYSIYRTEKNETRLHNYDTITKEEIDNIIIDKMLENVIGFSTGKVSYSGQEAFRLYKIFNSTFIEMRYSMGIG